MLTATEDARVKKFVADMDEDTANAMYDLFLITKPGCAPEAYDLMYVAHDYKEKASDHAIALFAQYGLVDYNGVMPKDVKTAIKKAVSMSFLAMHTPSSMKWSIKPKILK